MGDSSLVRLAKETGGRVEYPLVNPYSDVSGYLSTPSDDGNYALAVGSGGYASAKRAQWFMADYAANESQREKLDLRVHTLLPNLNPSTDLGRAGIASYAQRAGVRRSPRPRPRYRHHRPLHAFPTLRIAEHILRC